MLTTKKTKSNIVAYVITIGLFIVLVGFVFAVLSQASKKSGDEELRVVEEAIVRAVVSCYAFEGFYPESLDYLEQHYNLVINSQRFYVRYEKIADNVMPIIAVFDRRHVENSEVD